MLKKDKASGSLFDLQFAKLFGAQVIVTTTSVQKLEHLNSLGWDEVINYNKTLYLGRKVVEITDGQVADLVVEIGRVKTL